MYGQNTRYFGDTDTSSYFRQASCRALQEIERMPDKDIMSYDKNELLEYIYAKHEPDTLTINDLENPNIEMEQKTGTESCREMGWNGQIVDMQISVEYMYWYYTIRLTGNIDLIGIRPNSFTFSGRDYENIRIEKRPNKDGAYLLTVVIKREIHKASANENLEADIQRQFLQDLRMFQANLATVNSEIQNNRESFKKGIEQMLDQRIKKINAKQSIFAKFKIPVATTESVAKPIVLHKKMVTLPSKKQYAQNEYWIVEKAEVVEINNHIFSYLSSMERMAITYKNNDEEGIRNTLLGSLNVRFANATGETFSVKGKTDIFIGKYDRMAYIAECKIWTDKKKFLEAFGQLLGYTTWKECTGTIVVFNKNNKGFKPLLEKIETHITELQGYSGMKKIKPNCWEIAVAKNHEETMKITVMVFDYFTE